MPIPTVAEWLEEWSTSRRHHLEASSTHSYRVMADAYLLPHLGDLPLDRLDVRTLEATYARLLTSGGRSGRPLAPRTVAYAHAILHRSLVDAVRLGVLEVNPAAAVVIPRHRADGRGHRQLRVWDAAQVRHFLAVSADHPLAHLWAVALGTGMRRGELLALRRGDVDLEAALLTVEVALAQIGDEVHLKRPKTGRSRTISLDAATLDHLASRARSAPAADAPLFVDREGRHLRPRRVTDVWRGYVRTLDLPPIRLHDLRHTHATLLLAAGVPVKVVSERLGHTKITMTLDVYAHVLPAMDREAADRLGDLLTG